MTTDTIPTDREFLIRARDLIRAHANEDYAYAVPRNIDLTALAVGVDVAFGMGAPAAVLKESLVVAYLLGRMDGINAQVTA